MKCRELFVCEQEVDECAGAAPHVLRTLDGGVLQCNARAIHLAKETAFGVRVERKSLHDESDFVLHPLP